MPPEASCRHHNGPGRSPAHFLPVYGLAAAPGMDGSSMPPQTGVRDLLLGHWVKHGVAKAGSRSTGSGVLPKENLRHRRWHRRGMAERGQPCCCTKHCTLSIAVAQPSLQLLQQQLLLILQPHPSCRTRHSLAAEVVIVGRHGERQTHVFLEEALKRVGTVGWRCWTGQRR